MTIAPLLETPGELTGASAQAGPIVLMSRIRVARNLSRFPFPGWAKESQRKEVRRLCFEALQRHPEMAEANAFAIESLPETERLLLVERHLISRELMAAKRDSGFVVNRPQTVAIMVNEEDHLRMQFLRVGFKLKQLWVTASEFDSRLEERLDFAFNDRLGYLTACPTNVGTGLRASVMMHLPGLVQSGHMEKVVRAVNQFGLAVRGLFGEDSEASGHIFQISNQQTLGETEEEIIQRLGVFLQTIIEQENNARHKLLEGETPKLLDLVGRAYGILRHSHLLSSAEAMNQLSLLRLAADLKLVDENQRNLVDRLFIEVQPGHVQYLAHGRLESTRRDVTRAALVRKEMERFPAPAFDFNPGDN